MFARRIAHVVTVQREVVDSASGFADDDARAVYRVRGPLFFGSSNDLYSQFSYAEDPALVEIDMSESHVWDASSVSALDSIATRYEGLGKTLKVTGLNEPSEVLRERLSGRE